jgi:sigma-B regulation protein RsbU (phosphoserine phosphatase)
VFGNTLALGDMAYGQVFWALFLIIVTLFLVVELVSLVIGVSISRTITSAVHELYLGTRRVKEGDFSHRIPVRGNDQLAELGASFNTMTENLERLIVVAKEKERLESELEIAREVQSQLFPKDVPNLKTLLLTGVCNPARVVSGDYYDFMRFDSSMAFAIGDVAGKGISAALLMASIQSTMRMQLTGGAPGSLADGDCSRALSTAAMVSRLNKQLYANTSAEKYATFYFALYDEKTQTLTYTNAGHLQPILLRGGTANLLEVTGTVVGAFPFSAYEEKNIQLVSGDVLVAYTDGMIEPENEYGEMFGEQRLTDLLAKNVDRDSPEMIARVMEAVVQWSGSAAELSDDMTMLVARRP